jgi:tRNA(fMet)-specific endonuclease VapC
MAVYLLETSMFSLLVKQDPTVRARVAPLSATDRIVVCRIVRGEGLYGLERMSQGKKRQNLEARIAQLFASIPCEPIPEAAGDRYAHIKREAERKDTLLDENDLWIAATALSLGAVLVTADSDFHRIGGLNVEDWTQ